MKIKKPQQARKPRRYDEIIARLAPNGTLVEVGTWKGATALKVLQFRRDVNVVMVDPWLSGLIDPGLIVPAWLDSGSKMALADQSEVEAIHNSVVEKTRQFGERARILRMESVEAAQQFAGGSLDMVFIDANHSLEAVRSDIAAWLGKVKPGGIIGGHDYNHPRYPGCKQAVLEAFKEETISMGVDRTWWRTV